IISLLILLEYSLRIGIKSLFLEKKIYVNIKETKVCEKPNPIAKSSNEGEKHQSNIITVTRHKL
ncbi:hypothetical protein, partial [Vibrio parahaemolyticus]|uniref:hypothetical protein n=1 Tax=Vibrio parahaemolyticus TaxID=670 RepID=UPI001E448B6D